MQLLIAACGSILRWSYRSDTMAIVKIAISVPDDVFEAGENLASQLGLSRSQLYANALSAYLSERGAAAVTKKLNSIYAKESSNVDSALSRVQLSRLADEAW
jgi:metal-responsive CopG/Arc/MetJ family transcriptional regulator